MNPTYESVTAEQVAREFALLAALLERFHDKFPDHPELEMVEGLRLFIRNRTQYISEAGSSLPAATPHELPDDRQKPGFVYLGRSRAHSLTKIGWSQFPVFRERTLQGEDPCYSVLWLSRFGLTVGDEKALHSDYSEKRRRGEWFDLSEQDISRIKTRLE